MLDFITQGGYVMWLLIIGFAIILIHSVSKAVQLFSRENENIVGAKKGLSHIPAGGAFLALLGVFGTLQGIYNAFITISSAPEISPQIVFAGFSVALSSSLLGLFFCCILILIWMILKFKQESLQQ